MTKMYDQTTGELCGKCGWSMKFPDEPCRCELERENAALRADKERLDWLDHNAIPWTWMSPEKIDGLGPIVVTWKSNRTLRAAIDAARKEAQP